MVRAQSPRQSSTLMVTSHHRSPDLAGLDKADDPLLTLSFLFLTLLPLCSYCSLHIHRSCQKQSTLPLPLSFTAFHRRLIHSDLNRTSPGPNQTIRTATAAARQVEAPFPFLLLRAVPSLPTRPTRARSSQIAAPRMVVPVQPRVLPTRSATTQEVPLAQHMLLSITLLILLVKVRPKEDFPPPA